MFSSQKPSPSPAVVLRLRRASTGGWGLLLAAVCMAASATPPELPAPPRELTTVAPPTLPQNPARPASAPTAQAMSSAQQQDGAQAALALAGRALADSRIAYGPEDGRLSVPLIQQAHLRQAAGDAAGALADYLRAVELAEAQGGPRDPRLYEAWYGMGYLHLAQGQVLPAQVAFANALQLHRLGRGLYSAGQLEVLQALAVATDASGDREDADEWQIRRVEVAERVYHDDPAQLAALYVSAGRWFREAGNSPNAIGLHAQAVQLLDNNGGREQAALFEPLLELALSGGLRRREIDQPSLSPGIQPATALARAERILSAQSAAPAAQQAAQWLRLGDVHITLGRDGPALEAYARAAELERTAGQPVTLVQPKFLQLAVPQARVAGSGGVLIAEFDVDAQGRVLKPRIVQRQPQNLPTSVDNALLQALRAARLRPAIRDGKPQSSQGLRYRLSVGGDSA